MKKPFLILVIVLQASLTMAQFNAEKDPFMTKPLSNENIKNAEVQTSGGSISVSAVNPSEARIEVYIQAGNGKGNLSKEEIQKRLDGKYDLTISVSNNKVRAIAKNKVNISDWKNALSISFKVFVPKNVSTDLNTSGGSINLDGISGDQDFTTSGGSLNVENVSGKVRGRTSGGSINVENSTDDIELTTSGGSISAGNCNGKLKLTTSGGSLELKDLAGDIEATTSGGSVRGKRIAGRLSSHTSGGSIYLDDLTCSLETSTSGGNIDITVKEPGKYIKVSNSSGDIELQLPKGKGLDLDLSANKIKTDQFDNFKGKIEEGIVEGTINGGGIPVEVRSGNGKISFLLK
ncbi:MAG: hypothetical protein Q8941_19010 [Bacteroidota bacterium]|nr:hypothetical protein [Bacteroidota bacterium]